ncbi:DUF3857 domain-containing protein [Chondrinema litorale]|uniref:DUF3857 domain-containing protein n=1 Tax=Chondrinema litorale TaxID=2994555 RepID=UPI00254383EF|nr:DUF3857 domain-containing protein [Chondrinema litorale]UZR97147.1 DUF3857 domain-containing protein [Chondrinema litorale]
MKNILLFTLLSYSNVFAYSNISDSTFNDLCSSSDAYMLYSYTDVIYTQSIFGFSKKTFVRNKLVINNKTGVEKHAFFNLSKYVADRIYQLSIKTLKADGTTLELDLDIVKNHQFDGEKFELFNYPIPGVEPGDTIETFYEYSETLKLRELKDFVSLYDNVPSFNTEFSIRVNPGLAIRFKDYNGFPNPQVVANDTLVYCLFKMENLEGVSESEYTCLPCELPYLYYSVDKENAEFRTWKDIYNEEFNFVTQPFLLDLEKSSYYKKWKNKVIGEAKDSTKYYKLELLLQDIYNNIEIEAMNEEELIKSTGYFLKQKRFDPVSIKRLYRQLLEDLEIEYFAVFARSKRLGEIDPFYIRQGEYDHIFFAFKNSKGNLRLLYPHELNYKYFIDEIPTSLYNVEAVIVQPFIAEKLRKRDKFISSDLKMAEVDSVTIDVVNLPGMNTNANYIKQVFFCDIDVKNKLASFKSNFAVSGGLSTDLRSFFSLLEKNKEMNDLYDALAEFEDDETSLQIDTLLDAELNSNSPFKYSLDAKGTLTKSLTFLNDSIVSVTFDELIQHSQVESDVDYTKLNYYLDYSYTDFCMLILKFPCEIELISFEGYKKSVKNEIGEYLFEIELINNNQLIFKSNYKILEDIITKKSYTKLKDLNNLVEEVKNLRLLLKLKDV